MLTNSRVTPRASSLPTRALSSAGADHASGDKAGDGNHTSRVVPFEMVAIPWPDAVVVMS